LKAKLFRTGVRDCIHKPYLVDHILERVEALLVDS
jgi:DNA-binding response OmpR family regulator